MTRTARLVLGCFIALAWCMPLSAQEPTPRFKDLVAFYRGGQREQAIAGMQTLMAAMRAPDRSHNRFRISVPDEIDDWIAQARRTDDRPALEAALLLVSDCYFRRGTATASPRVFELLATTIRLQQMIVNVHNALSSIDSRTPFLRRWYLLWESFHHGQALLSTTPDYLMIGLRSFPDDAELLLSAGTRYEVYWWNSDKNPQRDPEGEPGSTGKTLRTAADWLRKSLAADPHLLEAQLHLGRVLFLLGDMEGATRELSAFLKASKEPAPRYLGLLFMGDVLERSDRAAAAHAFESAIGLVQVAQSAHLALARLAHADGRRADAAEAVEKAFSAPEAGADPWWWYVRGQWWQYENHLNAARAMVVQ